MGTGVLLAAGRRAAVRAPAAESRDRTRCRDRTRDGPHDETPVPDPDAAAVRLTLLSPDGDMGFPGTLDVAVT
ncbi:hypothetical protein ACWEPO_23085, partial [Streptomyces albidoflavus]